MIRSAGILMHITSLPSPYGIGTMGKAAREFVDFLAASGQLYWQILPAGPTGFGNSPYQALSSYAGNPYLIDLDDLIEEGLLTKEEVKEVKWQKNKTQVDFGILYNERYKILRLAAGRLASAHPKEYLEFLRSERSWLRDYAVFMAIKNDRKGAAWLSWPKELRIHNSDTVRQEAERLKEDVIFYERMQYLFFRQFRALKKYANDRGILLMGDLPFYVAADSIDVWSHPEQFDINENYEMTFVSGFPADAGNPKGQKWGNPLFNWNRMRNEGYSWWIDRMAFQTKMYDAIRIDHFQGYEKFFAIPANDPDAVNGHFEKGPGLELFRKMEERLGRITIILEDLGQLTPEFLQMVKDSGYPGMRILEYAFDPNDPGSLYMPFQYEKNTVVYTGTHDNDTLAGWLKDPANKARVERATKYFALTKAEGLTWGILRGAYASTSDLAIIQMQDILGLDSKSRMNDPAGTIQPWTWRAQPGVFTKEISSRLKEMMLLYCRNNWNAVVKAPEEK